jgi:NTP pyrophosphatase (non-canonical NTP hydrolase)
MTDFRKLAEKLADRLTNANTILAYLSEKNIIDDEETIMKTWEILADAYNDIHEPEND